jgi:Flp pilus assembly protein TadD
MARVANGGRGLVGRKKRIQAKPAAARPRAWTDNAALHGAAVALLALVAYWNSLGGGFHFDDAEIFLNPYIVSSGFGWGILRLAQTRPLTFLSFHWNYLAGGAAPYGFHLVNVLLHAANAVLAMLIARRAFKGPLALLAGALFALHPLQSQAVNYVFERATLLAAFFALLSVLFYLREKYWWAVAAFGLLLLAKEETIALPAFLLLYEISRGRRIRWAPYAAMLGLGAAATARLSYALHVTREAKLGFGRAGISVASYGLTQCRVIWTYLRLFVAPAGLSLDHDVKLSHGLFAPPATFVALLALLALVGALAWLAWRGSQPALWALGFFVLLAPSSSIIPVVDVMFEHRTYFPLLGLAMAAAWALGRLPGRARAAALAVLLPAMLAATVARNRAWRDERSLWSDALEKAPGKARVYFQLGQTYVSENPALARQWYERGLAIDPDDPNGHTNLGLILRSRGDADGALREFQRALQLGGLQPLIWNDIGATQLERGDAEEGIRAFRMALKSDPCRFDARSNLTLTLASAGDRAAAAEASRVPAGCRLQPAQIQKLEAERRSLE